LGNRSLQVADPVQVVLPPHGLALFLHCQQHLHSTGYLTRT
jgi:hypothetical protein